MRMFNVGLLALLVAISGCATAPVPREIVTNFSYQEAYDDVWTSVVQTFAELNLPIENLEKDSGLITTDWLSLDGAQAKEYCDCGYEGAFSIIVGYQVRFNVFVQQAAAARQMRVNATFRQHLTADGRSGMKDCVSTGGFESRIKQLVDDRLAAREGEVSAGE